MTMTNEILEVLQLYVDIENIVDELENIVDELEIIIPEKKKKTISY